MRRPLDPRICNIAVDANALNRDGNEKLVDRFEELAQSDKVRIVLAGGVRKEIQHPCAPRGKKDALLPQIFNLRPELTASQKRDRDAVRVYLQGNAKAGKHDADASHLSEAAETGCGFFITNDGRMLRKRKGLASLLPPSLTIVNLQEFLQVYDDYESSDAQKSSTPLPAPDDQMTDAERADRKSQKQRAVEAVQAVFSYLEGEGRNPDVWESRCLAEAIGAIYRGIYQLGATEASLALTPPERRASPGKQNPNAGKQQFDLPALRQAFDAAVEAPLRRFPHFGPIVFTDAA
jgi:hypothetical protein